MRSATRAAATASALALLAACSTSHPHQVVRASAPVLPAPVVVAAPTTTAPPVDLPDAHALQLAFADAKRDTGTLPGPFTPHKIPSWATIPGSATHFAVEPLGASLDISSVEGGPVTSTDAAMTPKGAPLTLLELGRHTAADGTVWVKVLLPVRPNQTIGYVRADATKQDTTMWQLDVHQRQHKLLVWFGQTLVSELTVAVGAPATFTPNGQFYVDVVVDTGSPQGAYGKWILGLNGFSDVYDTFGGGDALIGIHGTNEPASYGHSVSHGCVRAPNPEIAALARLLPLGAPVDISA